MHRSRSIEQGLGDAHDVYRTWLIQQVCAYRTIGGFLTTHLITPVERGLWLESLPSYRGIESRSL